MARSKRRTPIRGITTAESEKQDKQWVHRKYRRATRVGLQHVLDAEIFPHVRELSHPWSMGKDGKVRKQRWLMSVMGWLPIIHLTVMPTTKRTMVMMGRLTELL
jgi:hypothetical protein